MHIDLSHLVHPWRFLVLAFRLIAMPYFIVVLLAPLFALAFLPFKKKHRNLFYLISLLISLIAIYASFKVDVNLSYSIPSLGFAILVDKYSCVFLSLISCTWFISIVYSFEFTKYHFQEKKTQFFFYLNSLLTIVILNACAGNLITLFTFYVIGIPLSYPLITLRGNRIATKSGKKFLRQTLLPSFLIFLPALLVTQNLLGVVSFGSGNTFGQNHVDMMLGGILLAMFVIGISKNCVLPFHTWLPKTKTAPAPVSGLIHSVGTVKTGSIALVKIAIYVFGLDYIHDLTINFFTGGWLICLCGLTAIYTAYRALISDDLKQRFAFSTVGQLSYIVLAILIGSQTGITAAMLHIVTHAIAKSCLFYVAGFYNSVYKTTSIKAIAPIMPQTRFVALVVAICGLSITGFPFLAGYYSKDMMLTEEWNAHYYASAIFLIIGSIVNIIYIIEPLKSVFKAKDPNSIVKPIPLTMLATFIISIALIVGSNFYVSRIIEVLIVPAK
jgi:multicomponent Na+:H+ antiporter subunit D